MELWNHVQVALVLLFGLLFGMLNGINDVSGLVGTLCSSRAMRLMRAHWLAIAGFWVGIWLGADIVSRTVCLGLVRFQGFSQSVALNIWLGALGGSLTWGWLARRYSIPCSATHSFIGAMCGSALVAAGSPAPVNWSTGVSKVLLGLLFSPLLGGTLGFLAFRGLVLSLHRATPAIFLRLRQGERLAVFLQCLSYGLNDAHALMGLLMGACLSAGLAEVDPENFRVIWQVKLLVAVSLSLGALIGSTGMLRSMGRGLYLVRPPEALAAQSAAALAVLSAAACGAPVSSSQVNSSALIGVGGAWRPRHVRWRKVWAIALTWVITFPCALVVGGLLCALATGLTHGLVSRG